MGMIGVVETDWRICQVPKVAKSLERTDPRVARFQYALIAFLTAAVIIGAQFGPAYP